MSSTYLTTELSRWETSLKAREQRLQMLQKNISAEKWDTLLQNKVQLVEEASVQAQEAMTRAARKYMHDNSTEFSKATDVKLKQNTVFTEEVKVVADTEASIKEFKQAVRKLNTKSWKEVWADVKRYFKGEKAPPRGVDEELAILHKKLALLSERLVKHTAAVDHLRTLARTEVEAEYMEQERKNAVKSSQAVKTALAKSFAVFSDAVDHLNSSLGRAFDAVHKELGKHSATVQKLTDIVVEHTSLVQSIDTALATLVGHGNGMRQGSPAFVKALLTAMNEAGIVPMTAPASVETAKNRCLAPSRTITAYQRAVAVMSSPEWSMNTLVYHGMGTGKTCSIGLGLQVMAAYYAKHPPLNNIVAGALVLVQNKASIPTYHETMSWCVDAAAMKGLVVDAKAVQHSSDTHSWCIKDNRSGQTVLRVVVHRMTVALSTPGDWTKDSTPLPRGVSKWELPRAGAVFVDEAHNLFNSERMDTNASNNHTISFLKQMIARPDLKKSLFTGTPVLAVDRVDDLFRLLDFLRKDSAPAIEALYNASSDLVTRPARMDPKMVDTWFVKSGDSYNWKADMEDLFKRRVHGYVSYVSLDNDIEVFPRQQVVWNQQAYAGGVTARFDTSSNQFVDVMDSSSTIKKPLMVVTVPSSAYHSKKEVEKTRSANARIGVHCTKYTEKGKDMLPPKYYAIKAAIGMHGTRKHFVFLDKSDISKSLVALAKFLKFTEFTLPGSTSVEQWYKTAKPAPRCLILRKESLVQQLLEFYNHPANTRGDYIRIVFGSLSVKEGISLFSTHMVHFAEPPAETTVFEQASKRAIRQCSMKEVPSVKDWAVTTIIYVAEGSAREKQQLASVLSVHETPVTLVYKALQSAALDCQLYTAVTKTPCFMTDKANKSKDTQGTLCLDPADGSSKMIVYQVTDGRVQTTEQQCLAEAHIPGGLLHYDLWDEVLLKLMLRYGYKGKPLTLPKLVKQFQENASKAVFSNIYGEGYHTPRLSFSRTVSPEILAIWIEASPVELGNAVMYLLQQKRAAADSKALVKLEKTADLRVTKAESALKQHHSLMEVLHTVEKHMEAKDTELGALLDAFTTVARKASDLRLAVGVSSSTSTRNSRTSRSSRSSRVSHLS